jgi:hypothetical protein
MGDTRKGRSIQRRGEDADDEQHNTWAEELTGT